MLVYVAYGLVVAHVALGSLQASRVPSPLAPRCSERDGLRAAHRGGVAGARRSTTPSGPAGGDGWVDVCAVDEIPRLRARMATVGGERIAVFRYDGKVSCVSNVCRHQNGPLGEGKIVDGCITCPWHGYQYLPDNGTVTAAVHREDSDLPGPGRQVAGCMSIRAPTRRAPGWNRRDSRTADAGRRGTPTAAPAHDPFYVGYHPAAPAPIARGRYGPPSSGCWCLVLSAGAAVAATQDRAEPGVFEYGQLRTLHGQIREFPYPMLLVPGKRRHRSSGGLHPLPAGRGGKAWRGVTHRGARRAVGRSAGHPHRARRTADAGGGGQRPHADATGA